MNAEFTRENSKPTDSRIPRPSTYLTFLVQQKFRLWINAPVLSWMDSQLYWCSLRKRFRIFLNVSENETTQGNDYNPFIVWLYMNIYPEICLQSSKTNSIHSWSLNYLYHLVSKFCVRPFKCSLKISKTHLVPQLY